MDNKDDMEQAIPLLHRQVDILNTFYDETNVFTRQKLKGEGFEDLEDYCALIELRKGFVNEINEIDSQLNSLNYDKTNKIVLKIKDEAKAIFQSILRAEEELNNKVTSFRGEFEKEFKKVNNSIAYNEIAFDGMPMSGSLLNKSK